MSRSDLRFIVALVLLVFFFWGEPDVMDALIDYSTNALCVSEHCGNDAPTEPKE